MGSPFHMYTLLPSLMLDTRTSISELQAQCLRDSNPSMLASSEGTGVSNPCRVAGRPDLHCLFFHILCPFPTPWVSLL